MAFLIHDQRSVFRLLAASLTLSAGCTLLGPVQLPKIAASAVLSASAAPTSSALATPTPAPTPLPKAFPNMPAELNAGLNASGALNEILPQLYNPLDQSTEGATAAGVMAALTFAAQPSNLLMEAGGKVSNESPSGSALADSAAISSVLATLPVPPASDESTFTANLRESANFTTQALAKGGATIALGSAEAPITLDSTSAPTLKAGTSLKVYGSVSSLTKSIFLTQLYMKAGSVIANVDGSTATLASDVMLGHDTLVVSKKGMNSYALFVDPFTQAGLMMLQRTVTPTDTGATMKFVMDFRDFSSYKVDASGNFTTPGLDKADARLQNFRSLVQNYSHAVVTLTYVKVGNATGKVTATFTDVRNFSGQTVMASYSIPNLALSGVNNSALLATSNLQ